MTENPVTLAKVDVRHRDWLKAIVWSLIIVYMVAAVAAVLYFAAHALAGNPPDPVCTEPATVGGPGWGISAIQCEQR